MYKYTCRMTNDEIASRQAGIDTIAAMTHPVRRRLIDLLSADGPATVGMLADKTGERVGSISHHLKVLASNRLILEAPELARDRRESWWRIAKGSWSWSITNFEGDPAGELVARTAEEQQLAANFEKARAWYASRDDYDPAWAQAASVTTSWIRATPVELTELGQRLNQVVLDFVDEHSDYEEGDGREAVFLFSYAMPVKP
jgi:DNA-binding transcriptional ArsR family regulator